MHVSKIIDKIKFSIFSPEMIRKMSSSKILVPDTYDDDGYPIDGGLVDTKLGVVDPGLRCKTCGGRVRECPGHFGHIDLVRPVVHVEFGKQILYVLKSTCFSCHKLVLKPKMETIEEEEDAKKKKKVKTCSNCSTELPIYKLLKPTTFYRDKSIILPTELREHLAAISDEDLRELGFDPLYSRPEWMVITSLPVPPVNVRPSITLETGERSEDDLTHKLVDIIRINQKLEANINAGAPQLIIEDLWELLQYHVTTYFNNETANIPPARHRSGRPLKTLAQRLKGKEGRFRYNLSGKRVNFSARTVISPDPAISLNEIGIPERIAEELSVPIRVTEWNIEECKKYIMADKFPRAVYLIRGDGRRVKVGDEEVMKKEICENIKVGWVMERHIIDGDIAIFNRQPSLHRISMMAHEARILPGKTFRLNPVVTSPYNADFDGDEMNLHIIQTPESQAEARCLMKVDGQILSPRHGHSIIKPQEDHVSAIYFLTHKDALFDKIEASNLLYSVGIFELPEPDKKDKYSGTLLFSQLLPDDFSIKSRSKLGEEVVIRKGELVKGSLGGKVVENEILEKIFIDYGPGTAGKFLDRITNLALQALAMRGLSVSIKDYSLSQKADEKVRKVNEKMSREIDNLVMQYKNRSLERSPGLSLKETLEGLVLQTTGNARNEAGKIVEEDLTFENPSIVMARIGARGSLLNAIQMSALVAQQAVRSKRPKRGYRGRTLPYFKPGILAAGERGYVFSSFRTGLTPYEFIHHSMGGREALVNTAIRTARSGYMQRRLINALQDLVVYDDISVRNADMSVVQFIYGGDGKDPMYSSKTEASDEPKGDDVDTA